MDVVASGRQLARQLDGHPHAAADTPVAKAGQAKNGLMGGMWPTEQTMHAYADAKAQVPKAIAEANAAFARAAALSTSLAKFNVALSYSGNLHDIAHGTILRARIGELEQEQLRLRAQISQRQHKIEELQASLQKAQGGELAEVAKRREQLDAQIQEEQAAIKRAEDRLNQLQGGSPPPATPPPSTTTPPR